MELLQSAREICPFSTDFASPGVCDRPRKESGMYSTHFWFLFTASHVLVNARAKWQVQSDNVILELGLQSCQQNLQLLYSNDNNELVLSFAKIVDHITNTGVDELAKQFIDQFDMHFVLAAMSSGPGKLRFFDIISVPNDDWTITTDFDGTMNACTEHFFTRKCSKQFDESINPLEKSYSASANSPLDLARTAPFSLCSFYASYLQQKALNTKLSHAVQKINVVRRLEKLDSTVKCVSLKNVKNV